MSSPYTHIRGYTHYGPTEKAWYDENTRRELCDQNPNCIGYTKYDWPYQEQGVLLLKKPDGSTPYYVTPNATAPYAYLKPSYINTLTDRDCKATWEDWGACDGRCAVNGGEGTSSQRYNVTTYPILDGKPCESESGTLRRLPCKLPCKSAKELMALRANLPVQTIDRGQCVRHRCKQGECCFQKTYANGLTDSICLPSSQPCVQSNFKNDTLSGDLFHGNDPIVPVDCNFVWPGFVWDRKSECYIRDPIILTHPKNGGKPCPTRQITRCRN